MQAYRLIPHPACAPVLVSSVEAKLGFGGPHWLQLRFRIEGSGKLVLPRIGRKARVDGLWQATCFELFLRPMGGEKYQEWNLSPSRGWNSYIFDGYRDGMRPAEAERAPDCVMRPGSKFAIFDAAIPLALMPDVPCKMGLSAVIEEEGGIKSYWALAHPDGDKPDFHDPACFAATLDPPTAA